MEGENKISDKEIEVLTDENSRVFDKEWKPAEDNDISNEITEKDISSGTKQETIINNEKAQAGARAGDVSDAGEGNVSQRESKEEALAIIDNYISETPLEGCALDIYAASAAHGVDYRSTLAIAQLESSCGESCFLPFNAWGWGNSSWSNWEEAIWEFTRQFSNVYGSKLDPVGALKYCPTNESYWVIYSNEMNYITESYYE